MSTTVRSVILDLIGRDNASRAFLSAARNAEKAANSYERFGYRTMAMGSRIQSAGTKMTKSVTLPLLAVGALAVKVAADYDKSLNTIRVATDASAKDMKTLRSGIQGIALTTGDSLHELTDGAYVIQKSTRNAADTLKILGAATKGAKAEGADLAIVTNALTSVMASYNLKADQATSAQNMLIRGAGLAKTTLQDFANSLSNVVPLASALGISIPEVFGAIATMTQHGESAQRSTENLSSLISSLAGGSNVSSQALQQLDVNVVDLQKHLGDRGLSGTLSIVLGALKKHGKDGLVVYDSFKHAALGAQSMTDMLKGMNGQLRFNSENLLKGKTSIGDYRKFAKEAGATQGNLAFQFLASYRAQTGFNNLLKSGRGNQQTYARALLQSLGGITNMQTALKLLGPEFAKTGKASDLWLQNIASIKKAGRNNKDIEGWAQTAKLFSTQWEQFRSKLQVWLVGVGTKLMPTAEGLLKVLKGVFDFFGKLGGVLGGQATKWLLLVAAIGPVIAIAGRLLRTFGLVYLAIYRLATFSLGFRGVTTGLATMNSGAYLAGKRMGGLSSALRSFGGVASGLTAGIFAGQMSGGGKQGLIKSILFGAGGGALGGSLFGGVGALVGGLVGGITGAVSHFLSTNTDAQKAYRDKVLQWTADVSAAADSYNGILSKTGKILQANLNDAAANNLNKSGALTLGGSVGLSGSTMISAATGDQKAIATITRQVAALQASGALTKDQADKITTAIGIQSAAVQKQVKDQLALNDALGKSKDMHVKIGKLIKENKSKDLFLDTSVYDKKKNQFDKRANGAAVLQYPGQIGQLDKLLNKPGLKSNTTAAAIEATHWVEAHIKALQREALAQVKSGKSGKVVSDNYQKQLGNLKQLLVQAGFNKQALDFLFAEFGKMPKTVKTQIQLQHAEALHRLAVVQNKIRLLKQNKLPGINVNTAAGRAMLDRLEHKAKHLLDSVLPKLNIDPSEAQGTYASLVNLLTNTPITIPVRMGSIPRPGVPTLITGGGRIPKTNARGTDGLPDGWFTVGERGWELGHKHGGKVRIFSNSHSKAMLGSKKVPGFAGGTGGITHQGDNWIYGGIKYGSQRAAENARTRAANKKKVTKADWQGVVSGLAGAVFNPGSGKSDIVSATRALLKLAKAAGVASKTLTRMTHESNRLARLAGRRDKLRERLGTAPTRPTAFDRLGTLRDARASQRDNIRGTFAGTFSAASAGVRDQVYNDKPAPKISASTILTDLTRAATKARKFAATLVKLGKMHLPGFMLRQLAEAGPDALPQALALAQSSKAQLAAFRKEGRILDSAGKRAGNYEAGREYDARITRAHNRVLKLQRQIRDLNRKIHNLGLTLDNQARHAGGLPNDKTHHMQHAPTTHHKHPHHHKKRHHGHGGAQHHDAGVTVNVYPSANMDEVALAVAVGRRVQAHLGAM